MGSLEIKNIINGHLVGAKIRNMRSREHQKLTYAQFCGPVLLSIFKIVMYVNKS